MGADTARKHGRRRRSALLWVGGGFSVFLLGVGCLFLLSFALPSDEDGYHTRNTRGRRLKASRVEQLDVPLAAGKECVQGFNGDADGLATVHGALASPRIAEQPIYPCPQFQTNVEGACCNNVLANEIAMGYDHTFDVGGTGKGTPRTQSCLYKAREKYDELNEYFCMFCNPKQINFMSCCSNNADGSVSNRTQCTGTEYLVGTGNCTSSTVNTIRVCKNYALRAWDQQTDPMTLKDLPPGGFYDECGMLMYIGGDVDLGNPNGVLPWGDVDGGHDGDDPVIPSKMWGSFVEFARDMKPPLFDQFAVIIAEDNKNCFNGHFNAGLSAHAALSLTSTLALSLAATMLLSWQ